MQPGERIKFVRNELKINQDVFASAIGITKRTLINYEMGHTSLPAEILGNMVAIYDVNPLWFLTGTGPPFIGQDQQQPAEPCVCEPELEWKSALAERYQDEDLKLIMEELERSPATRLAVLKLLKAKRGSKEALEELEVLLQGVRMIQEGV